METICIEKGLGRLQINLSAVLTGSGVNLLLTGVEKPHVGGIVLCVPRPSLSGEGIGCDSWVIPVPGHKDVIAAEPVAQIICRKTGQTVSITAGIHCDDASPDEIKEIESSCMLAAQEVIGKILSRNN